MIKGVTLENFKEEVIEHQGLVLVDFYTSSCNPCKKVREVIEKVSSQFNNAKIVEVNIEESPELASRYMVMSIPALILFKEGRPQEKIVGLVSEREVLRMISRHS